MEKKHLKSECCIKDRVMGEIKGKNIRMKSRLACAAEKIGLESAAAAGVILGGLIVSLILYILKKIGAVKFLSLGIPGIKVFLLALPYGYIFLFFLVLFLAVYFVNRSQFFCGESTRIDIFYPVFFIAALFLGGVFLFLGAEKYFQDMEKNRLPKEMAIKGKIIQVGPESVIIEDEEGDLINIIMPPKKIYFEMNREQEGKFIWAVGKRDRERREYFEAEEISCCE